jgi:hypothetical protein
LTLRQAVSTAGYPTFGRRSRGSPEKADAAGLHYISP